MQNNSCTSYRNYVTQIYVISTTNIQINILEQVYMQSNSMLDIEYFLVKTMGITHEIN